jgi:hypothetical protein
MWKTLIKPAFSSEPSILSRSGYFMQALNTSLLPANGNRDFQPCFFTGA